MAAVLITSLAQAQTFTVEQDGIDNLGIDMSCNIWNTPNDETQPSLDDCEKDLTLIKNLGISWVRIGVPWHFLAKYNSTFLPARSAFLENLLKAARARGLKVLFSIGLEAPAWAYHDPSDPLVTGPSLHLDFNDADFETFLTQELAIAKDYTDQFELFNEVNWQYNLSTGEGEPSANALLSRMKGLYMITRQHLDNLTAQDTTYHPHLLSSGLSYFCNSGCNTTNLIPATDFIYWMENGWQPPGETILSDYIDTVSIHPYLTPTQYVSTVASFSSTLDSDVPPVNGSPKDIWFTETNVGNPSTDNQATGFLKTTEALDNGYATKAFWYVIRPSNANDTSCTPGVDTNYCWSIYQYDGSLKPGNQALENAILSAARAVPFDLRFSPPAAANLTYDFADHLGAAHAYGNGYPPSGTALVIGKEVALRGRDSLAKRISFRVLDFHSVQTDFNGIVIPTTGYPALRASVSASALPRRSSTKCTGGNLLVWIGVPGGDFIERSFDMTAGEMPQTFEIDMHDFLGKTVNISLDSRRDSTCDAPGHGPLEISVFLPQILTR